MREYYNNNSKLTLNQGTIFTLSGATQQEPAATGIDRLSFWSADIIVPLHVVLSGAHTVSVGLGLKQSDTALACTSGNSLITLATPSVVFTGVGTYATGLTTDLIVKFGVDLRQYNRYVQFDPLLIASGSDTGAGVIGEIVMLCDPMTKPQPG